MVTKYKPKRTPRMLDAQLEETKSSAVKLVRTAEETVSTSRSLVDDSRGLMERLVRDREERNGKKAG